MCVCVCVCVCVCGGGLWGGVRIQPCKLNFFILRNLIKSISDFRSFICFFVSKACLLDFIVLCKNM